MTEVSQAKAQHPLGQVRQAARVASRVLSRCSAAALNLVLPTSCASCGKELAEDASDPRLMSFCDECFAELALIGSAACPRCAAPVDASEVKSVAGPVRGCHRCRGRRFSFHGAFAAGQYTGRLRDLVLRMKRSEHDPVSLAMGRLMWHCCGEQLGSLSVDLLVPVPMHWRRRLSHGTNSAALVAEVLAGQLGVPLAVRLLRRHRNTPPQFSLTPPQRRANVRGAFTVRAGYPIARAHVLLVDDIMTSGATANEAARMLKRAGARRVTVVVAARATSY